MHFCPDPPYVERRGKGKTVTVLKNVQGDVSGLLLKLKVGLGVGGTQVSLQHIELQGDQVKRLKNELKKLKAITTVDEDEPVSHTYLRKVEDYLAKPKFVFPTANMQNSELCRKLHGDFWPYCVGTCRNVDFSDFFQTLSTDPPATIKPPCKISELHLFELFKSAELGSSIGTAVMKRLCGQDPDEVRKVERPVTERTKKTQVPLGAAYQRPYKPARSPPKPKREKAVNYVLRVRLPEDVDFGEFKLFVASACPGVLRVRQPRDDTSIEPRSLLGESNLQEVIIMFENINSLRSAKVIFDEMSTYQTREDGADEWAVSSEDAYDLPDEPKYSLLSEEQWETVRMLELEENEFFWSRLFRIIESGQTLEAAFADAVVECMSEEVEAFVPPHELWLKLSLNEHQELNKHHLENSPEFWESFELLTVAEIPGAFDEAIKAVSQTANKEESHKFNCPICGKKFDEEIDVMRHLDSCVSRFS
jgi:hypothetical protein